MSTQGILIALSCGRAGCPCAAAARRREGNTHCPSHDDGRPSLSVAERSGRVLVHCHAGCEQHGVVETLRAAGLWR